MIFTVSAKYIKEVGEEGEKEIKMVTERYIVDAVSVTDSEAKVIKFLPDNYRDKEITSSVINNLEEVIAVNFNRESDNFYLGRASYMEEKGKKLVRKQFSFMVNGTDLKNALENAQKFYADISTVEYTIESMSSSKLICDSDLVNINTVTNS